jgi:hypothetical protein
MTGAQEEPPPALKEELKEECYCCRFWHSFSQRPYCRRFPPQPFADGAARFPYTAPNDWCGEFQRRG